MRCVPLSAAAPARRSLQCCTPTCLPSPARRRLWRLQQMAVKKQQAFQEALQSIPVSEMEKMVAAAVADLESATQCYERFVLANEGKGRCGCRSAASTTSR